MAGKRGTYIFKGGQGTVNLPFVWESLHENIHLINLRFSHLRNFQITFKQLCKFLIWIQKSIKISHTIWGLLLNGQTIAHPISRKILTQIEWNQRFYKKSWIQQHWHSVIFVIWHPMPNLYDISEKIKTVSHETAERKKVNKCWFDHKCEKKRDNIKNSFKGKSSNPLDRQLKEKFN